MTPTASVPDTSASSREERMRAILEKELAPSVFVVRDTSDRHRKHVEARTKGADLRGPHQVGQTHYELTIVSGKFDGMAPLARHRFVNDLLAPEFATGLHALTLHLQGEKA